MAFAVVQTSLIKASPNGQRAHLEGHPIVAIQYTKDTGDTSASAINTTLAEVYKVVFPAEIQGSFTQSLTAGTAQVFTILVNSNTGLAGKTLSVGTKTYTFVAGSPGANEIQVGANVGATALNIESAIDTDTADTGATASTSSATVTGTATSTSAPPYLATDATTQLTLAITTQPVPPMHRSGYIDVSGLGAETSGVFFVLGRVKG